MIAVDPLAEDWCQHDEIEHLCEPCKVAPIRCPHDDHPLMSADTACPFGPHDDRPVRGGATWSALMADIDTLIGADK